MKNQVKLDSEKYWRAAVDVEMKHARKQKNREAFSSLFLLTSCCAVFLVVCYAFSQGVFDNFDMLATLQGMGDGTTEIFNNIKNGWLK